MSQIFLDKSTRALCTLALILFAPISQAATATIDEAGINAIFSQASFGGTPIRIRFNPTQQIIAPDLLVVDTFAKLQALYSLATDPSPTVTAFFVDDLNACGQPEPEVNGNLAGCALLPGNRLVVDAGMAELVPDKLLAHELGHNLNLQHDFFYGLNLMTPLYPHGPELSEDQVAVILHSPLVQIDVTGQRFIQITPVEIVGVPEPATTFLLPPVLAVLILVRRRITV